MLKKNENEEKIQIGFILPSNKKRYLLFPNNITISEMVKAALSKLFLNSKSAHIIDLPNNITKINKLINKIVQLKKGDNCVIITQILFPLK